MKNLTTKQDGIEIRIFLGFLQKSELKMHLSQSREWQCSNSFHEENLIEVHRDKQEYIGIWIKAPVSYEILKKSEEDVRSRLQLYCPKIKLDAQHLYLFTQIFVN